MFVEAMRRCDGGRVSEVRRVRGSEKINESETCAKDESDNDPES